MILDVGCGHDPRGDVNCDLMVEKSDQEWDLNPQKIPNFVRADVRYLPFESRCFDLVYCSHVLEHLEDPGEGLAELKRVSRKTVAVIVPFALFRILDMFFHGRDYPKYLRWERRHHKHHFLMDPFKTGSFKLMFPNLAAALRKKKKFIGFPRVPIPFQTLTVLEIDQNE